MLLRVACDQLIFAPTFLAVYMTFAGVTEGSTKAELQERFNEKYLPILSTNYMVWPWIQMVNFTWVPLNYRTMVVNTVAIAWNTYLSYMSHS